MRIERRALFVGLAVIVLVLVLGTGATISTSRPSFCASCHEARAAYISWTYSTHQPVHCLTCHAGETGTFGFWKGHLLKGLPHTVSHFLGTYNVPLEADTIHNEVCLQCHQGMQRVAENGLIRMEHGLHLERGLLCITCHAGVVHTATAENPSPTPAMAGCQACHREQGGPVDDCSACHLKPP